MKVSCMVGFEDTNTIKYPYSIGICEILIIVFQLLIKNDITLTRMKTMITMGIDILA